MKKLLAIFLSFGLATSSFAGTEVNPVTALVGTGMFGAGAAATIQAQRYYNTLNRDQVVRLQQWSTWRITETEHIRNIRQALIEAGFKDQFVNDTIGMTHRTTFEEAIEKARKLAMSSLNIESPQYKKLIAELDGLQSALHKRTGPDVSMLKAMSAEAAQYNRSYSARLDVPVSVANRNFGRIAPSALEESAATVQRARVLRGAGVAGLIGGAFLIGTSLQDDVNDDYRGTPQYQPQIPVEEAAAEE